MVVRWTSKLADEDGQITRKKEEPQTPHIVKIPGLYWNQSMETSKETPGFLFAKGICWCLNSYPKLP